MSTRSANLRGGISILGALLALGGCSSQGGSQGQGAAAGAGPAKDAPAKAEPAKTAEPPKAAAKFITLSKEDVEKIVAPRMPFGPKGGGVGHDVFQGPFGPSEKTILAEGPYCGTEACYLQVFAFVPEGSDWKEMELQTLCEESNDPKVAAVLLDNLDADEAIEPIIMASCDDTPENGVYDWNGKEFVRLAALEGQIKGLKTAAEVRAALKK
jgi:hypothetical protein